MANNPYSPPTATVADGHASPVAPGPMPLNVKLAVAIFVVVELYALYNLHLGVLLEQVSSGELSSAILAGNLVAQVIYWFPLVFVLLRKHWARIMEVVLMSWLLLSLGLSEVLIRTTAPAGTLIRRDVWATAITLALLALRGGALALLFTPSANAWFRPRAAR